VRIGVIARERCKLWVRTTDLGSDQRLQHLVQFLVKGSKEISLEFHSELIPGLTTDARGAHCWTVAVRPGISVVAVGIDPL
jgi:hypothetical protein